MATGQFNITDTTYAGGHEPNYIITRATFGLETIKQGLVMVKDGIKKKHTISRLDLASPLQPRNENPVLGNPSGSTITLDGVVLDPQDIMAFQPFNPRNFETNWYAEELSPTLLARELPLTVSNYLMQYFMNKCFEGIENSMWMGSTTWGTSPTGTTVVTGAGSTDPRSQLIYFDGFVKKAITITGGTSVGGAVILTGSTSVANIYATMQNMYYSVKKALKIGSRRKNLRYILSIEDLSNFEQMLTITTYKNNDYTTQAIHMLFGIPVIGVPGLVAGTMFLCEALPNIESNLWFGLNSQDDFYLQIAKYLPASEYWFMKFLFKCDVQIAKLDEIVINTNLVLSDLDGAGAFLSA